MSETADPCPLCGKAVKRLPDHLPCEGVRPLEGYE